MKLFILLPCYNEGKALPFLMKSICEAVKDRYKDYEVVVIDDGSTDDTVNVAKIWMKRLNIKIISHEKNMGLGEAVNTGLKYFHCHAQDDDVAVLMDADNTHTPDHISNMLDIMANGNDVVVASRYANGGKEIGLSFFRRLCSVCINIMLSLIFKVPGVKDYTCGFRMYRGSALKKAFKIYGENFIEEEGFTCMSELLLKMSFIGCSVAEIPMVLRYDQKKGKSKMKVFKTIKRYFKLISNMLRYKKYLLSQVALIDEKGK